MRLLVLPSILVLLLASPGAAAENRAGPCDDNGHGDACCDFERLMADQCMGMPFATFEYVLGIACRTVTGYACIG